MSAAIEPSRAGWQRVSILNIVRNGKMAVSKPEVRAPPSEREVASPAVRASQRVSFTVRPYEDLRLLWRSCLIQILLGFHNRRGVDLRKRSRDIQEDKEYE